MAEDPSSHDEATLYVTHLREPISRSISHFKCKNCLEGVFEISSLPAVFSLFRHCHFIDNQTKAGGTATACLSMIHLYQQKIMLESLRLGIKLMVIILRHVCATARSLCRRVL